MELDISLAPTRELGYFCGLTFGDGVIKTQGLTRKFGELTAVDGLTLEVEDESP